MKHRLFTLGKGLKRLALVVPLVAVVTGVCVTITGEQPIFAFAVITFVLAVWAVATLYAVCRIVQWVIDGFWNPRIGGFVDKDLDALNVRLKDARSFARDVSHDVSDGMVTVWFKNVEGAQGKLVIRNVAGCDLKYRLDGEDERRDGEEGCPLARIAVDHRKDTITLWATGYCVCLRLDPCLWAVAVTCPAVRE